MVRSVRREKGERVDDTAQIPGHENDVAGLDGDVGAGADGQADVGLGQRRRVVDAVTDEGHLHALVLQALDLFGLVLGQHLGQHPLDAELGRDGLGRCACCRLSAWPRRC